MIIPPNNGTLGSLKTQYWKLNAFGKITQGGNDRKKKLISNKF